MNSISEKMSALKVRAERRLDANRVDIGYHAAMRKSRLPIAAVTLLLTGAFVGLGTSFAKQNVTAKVTANVPSSAAPSTQMSNETTTPSGLKIAVTKEAGPDDSAARKGDTVWVHYTGKLTNGTKFDSSLDRGEPIELPLGAGRVIKGWEEGLTGMKLGEKRTLTIPPELGYGARGAGQGVIPPNATLIFDVELVGLRKGS